MKAIRINEVGGAEVMGYEEVAQPVPQAGEVLVKVEAAGVNYIDTYHRSGLYPIPLPATLGVEAAGTVVEVAADSGGGGKSSAGSKGSDKKASKGNKKAKSRFKVGDRVVYANAGIPGAYAEYAALPEDILVPLPDKVSFNDGAAAMLQGCTAHYLCHSTYKVQKGDRCLIHAAAGGVGLLLIQMVKMAGGFVIGTCSTAEKAQLAKEAGADEVILYGEQDFHAEVQRITDGAGVNVAYDSVGKATFAKSLDCLAPLGYMVLYGNASGPVTEFNPATLAPKGSLFLTRPTLVHYIASRADLEWRSGDVFGWIKSGKLKLRTEHFYPLAEAVTAHQDLEARRTTGKVILTP